MRGNKSHIKRVKEMRKVCSSSNLRRLNPGVTQKLASLIFILLFIFMNY